MSGVSAIMAGPVQEVKARSLQILMAVLDEMHRGTSGKPIAAPDTPNLPHEAQILLPPRGNRLTLSLGGMPLEVVLPEHLAAAARAHPAWLARGTILPVEIDPRTGVLRLKPPAIAEAAPATTPATLRRLNAQGAGPSAPPAPPLPDHFPPGSPGALIQKLAHLHLPLAERGGAGAPPPQAIPALPPRGPGPATFSTLPPALLEATLRAAIRQMPLGTALTALLAAGDTLDPALAEALRGLRLDAGVKPDAGTIERGVRQSGLFAEANAARGASPAPDLKGLMQMIRASLAAPRTAGPADAPEPAMPTPTPRTGPDAPPARPADLARLAEGGMERITLQQIASLPDHHGMRVTDDRAEPARIALQIPLATAGPDRPETAMIGVMIEHDPRPGPPPEGQVEGEGAARAEGFPWKVRIALDLAETGPVQAEIALRGQSVGVTLWAERRTMADAARRALGDLHAALTGAAFEIAHLDVRDGRPAQPARPNAPHLDRRA